MRPLVLCERDVDTVAEHLIAHGRIIPGLTVDEHGRGRSWWWPLPAESDRRLVGALLTDPSEEAQAELAHLLANATDRMARQRLHEAQFEMLPRRPGRRSVPEAWLRSLSTIDPWMSPSLAPDRVRGFAAEIDQWVRSAAAKPGSVRLCLRIVEPQLDESDSVGEPAATPGPIWRVECVVRDAVDSALEVSFGQLLGGNASFGPDALEQALAALGMTARIAPELGALVKGKTPEPVEFGSADLIRFVESRLGPLADVGVAVLLPSWWATGARLGVKARASSSVSSGGSASLGLDLEAIVAFTWQAALGDLELNDAELVALEQAAASKQHLVQIRGRWLEIDPTQLAAVLRRAGTSGKARARELLRAGLHLDDLGVDDVDVVAVEDSGWIGDVLSGAAGGHVEVVESPPGFEGSLREYQQRGVGWLTFLGKLGLGACLADDMGLGKTAQLIAAMLSDRVDGPTLVVCPVSVLANWEREIARFAPDLSVVVHHGPHRPVDPGEFADAVADADVVLTTFSLAHRDVNLFGQLRWDRLALDEAQQIKNPGTKVAKAIRSLDADRRVALTGTPVENHLVELWSIMQFLNPGLLGTVTDFRRQFATPIEAHGDPEATERLSRITTPFVLRRLKSDKSIIDDLPDKIESTTPCPLTPEQVSLYQSVVDDLLENAEANDGIARRGLVLAGITKLKQVCNHPAHFLGDGSPLLGRSGKLNRVEELVAEMLEVDDKALIFTQYTAWGDRLARHLSARFGTEALWLHGGLPRQRRQEMVDGFSEIDGPPLMLLSLKAGGTGLNLTAANHVIHYDRWWNPAVEDQATDRAYRIGQRRSVQVHKLVSSGTIEEKIDQIIFNKRELAGRVVGAGEAWLTELDTQELADVLSLSGVAG